VLENHVSTKIDVFFWLHMGCFPWRGGRKRFKTAGKIPAEVIAMPDILTAAHTKALFLLAAGQGRVVVHDLCMKVARSRRKSRRCNYWHTKDEVNSEPRGIVCRRTMPGRESRCFVNIN
jgi:hypothetical protein